MMLKKMFVVAGMFTLLFATGCSVEPSKVDDGIAIKTSERITYFEDKRTGLCYAMVASRKTGSTDQTGLGMSVVPCEKVKHYLVN